MLPLQHTVLIFSRRAIFPGSRPVTFGIAAALLGGWWAGECAGRRVWWQGKGVVVVGRDIMDRPAENITKAG